MPLTKPGTPITCARQRPVNEPVLGVQPGSATETSIVLGQTMTMRIDALQHGGTSRTADRQHRVCPRETRSLPRQPGLYGKRQRLGTAIAMRLMIAHHPHDVRKMMRGHGAARLTPPTQSRQRDKPFTNGSRCSFTSYHDWYVSLSMSSCHQCSRIDVVVFGNRTLWPAWRQLRSTPQAMKRFQRYQAEGRCTHVGKTMPLSLRCAMSANLSLLKILIPAEGTCPCIYSVRR